MKRVIKAYNINFWEVDDDRVDYTWKINNYIHNMPNKPILWRLYKVKTSDRNHYKYKVVDVPEKRINDLVEGLKNMKLLKDKGASVNLVKEGNENVVIIDWHEPTD